MDPTQLDAVALGAAFRSGALSPVEATRAVLRQVEAGAALNAFCHVATEAALAAARASEARHRAGTPLSALDGVPVGIKDLLLTKGMPTRRGSLTTSPDGPWEDDAPCVARLREAGAVLLGKTTTPEFGWKGVTDNPLTGITRNPWNPECTPGGSSGGAAVQVATGMGPIGIGTDGGGSIRIPASFTGVFGFKPSYGRVPAWPASQVGTLAHAGPLTRTVADAALAMAVISGWDARDWTALPCEKLDWMGALERGIAGKRIAYAPTLGGAAVDPEVAALVRAAVEVLASLGAIVEEVTPPLGVEGEAIANLWRSGCARGQRFLTPEQKALLEPALRLAAEEGAKVTLAQWQDAMDARAALGVAMRTFHEQWDLLVLPTMKLTAFAVGQNAPLGADGQPDYAWNALCYQFNLTSQPAASIPCGLTSAGLPVGLQVVGPMHDDLGVLAACAAYERARGPLPLPPR